MLSFFFDSLATCCFCFPRWMVRLVISSTGNHFLFLFLISFVFFFSFLNAVRCKKPYRCTICCFVFLYNLRASATCRLLNVFQLRRTYIFFFWYCKERAYSSDAVFAEHVFHTCWPFFFLLFFSLLSYFRSILGTSFSVDYTCHVAMASTFALWRKMFLK